MGVAVLLGCLGVGASAGFVLGRVTNTIDFAEEPIPMAPVPAPEDEDVCCRGTDGLVRIMFLSECRQSRGKAVERKTCAVALKPVCCKRIGLSDWSDAQGCAKRGGTVVDEMSCRTQYDLICCEFPRTPEMPTSFVAWAGRDQCTKDRGTERSKARCEDPLETVCCQQPYNSAVVMESTRQNCQLRNYNEVAPDHCAKVCCRSSSSGTKWATKASCQRNQVVAGRDCEDVCCKIPNQRNALMNEGTCRERGGWASELPECGTVVDVERPANIPDDPVDPLPPSEPGSRVADRPPATTPYM